MSEHFKRPWSRRLKEKLATRPFKQARTEVLLTVLTATLPIWFFPALILFLVGYNFAWNSLDHSISNGELFLLCTSLVGPLTYTLFRVYEVSETEGLAKKFPYRISFAFPHGIKFAAAVFLICMISAAVFGFQKINPSFTGTNLNKFGYVALSILLSVISIISLFCATAIRNELDEYSPSKKMRRDEDAFVAEYTSEEGQQ